MKISPVGPELFNADGKTERRDETIVAFRNVANEPKKRMIYNMPARWFSQ